MQGPAGLSHGPGCVPARQSIKLIFFATFDPRVDSRKISNYIVAVFVTWMAMNFIVVPLVEPYVFLDVVYRSLVTFPISAVLGPAILYTLNKSGIRLKPTGN